MATRLGLVINSGRVQQLQSGDAIGVQAGAGGGLDVSAAGTLNLGVTTATAISIGSVGVLTTILGDLQVNGTETVIGTTTFEGDVDLGDNTGDTINLGGGSNDAVNLLTDLGLGAGLVTLGSSITDYASAIWLAEVAGSAGNVAVALNATAGAAAGSHGVGVNTATFVNIAPANPDLQTVLEAIDTAIGGSSETLQEAYENGNTIAVTTAEGSITFSNAADSTDVLTLSRTFAGAGSLVVGSMGATTTDHAIDLTMVAGSTGRGISIDANGTGMGVYVDHDGASGAGLRLEVSGSGGALAGALEIELTGAAFGQVISVPAASGAGAMYVYADGNGNHVWLDMTPGAAATGNGFVAISNANSSPSAGLLFINHLGGGTSVDVQDSGTSVFSITGAGVASLDSNAGVTNLAHTNSTSYVLGRSGLTTSTAYFRNVANTATNELKAVAGSATSGGACVGFYSGYAGSTLSATNVQAAIEELDAQASVGTIVSKTVNSVTGIDAGEAVALQNEGGAARAYKADHSSSASVLANAFGIATNTAGTGATVTVQVAGETAVIADGQWDAVPAVANVGQPVYGSPTTAGNLTLTAPSTAGQMAQQIGIVSVGGTGAVRIVLQVAPGIAQ